MLEASQNGRDPPSAIVWLNHHPWIQVVEVLNPLAREYKSIGTMKKELAELQEELAQAHQQVWKYLYLT